MAVSGDCNDGRADVSPTATESCRTGLDDNCDGDDNDIGAIGCSTFWPDADADGFGDATSPGACTCTASAAYPARDAEDCDDAGATVNPDQLEDCGTGFDDDCDADANDAGAAGCAYFYVDVDGDGFGDDALPDAASCTCEGAGYLTATVEGDCDDTDVRVSPAQSEVCGGGDEDCSGAVDDDATDATRWYRDSDGDRFGDSASSRLSCTTPAGYASVGADCDDGRSGVYPGRTEDCLTTFDDDCSGSDNDVGADACTTFYADADSDGYGVASDRTCTCGADTSTVYTSRVTGDCLDTNAGVSPGDTELCSTTGIDDDCDGTADEENASGCTSYFYDYDGDGYGTSTNRCLCSPSGYYTAATLGDCDDADAGTSPADLNCGLLGTVSTSSAAAVITGRSTYQFTGEYAGVVSLDYNRDGYVDVAVGSSGEDSGYANVGAVYVWLGGPEGFTGSHMATSAGDADVRWVGSVANAGCGGMLTASDVDGDGYDELLVGCMAGAASFLLEDGLEGLGTVTASSPGVITLVGRKSLFTGDRDGDGFADGILGTPGATYSFRGGAAGIATTTSPLEAVQIYNRHQAMLTSGDLDGDGFAEVIAQTGEFVVSVADGGSIGAYTTTLTGFQSVRAPAVQVVGDIDGDGRDDVAVGNAEYFPENPIYGTVLFGGWIKLLRGGVVSGGGGLVQPSGLVATSVDAHYFAAIEGVVANDNFGFTPSSAGDLDDDGSDDLAVASYSASKHTWVYYGPIAPDGGTRYSSDADAVLTSINTVSAAAGDMNADGYDDLWVGSSSLYLFHGTPR